MAVRGSQVGVFEGPRLIRREELAASSRLTALCFPFLVKELTEEEPVASYSPPRRGGTYVIAHRDLLVSQISLFHSQVKVYGSRLQVGSIGDVGTHPDYRGQGLATRLLDHCTRQLVHEGAQLMLISGTRGLYTRFGCVIAGEFQRFVLNPVQLSSMGDGFVLRRAAYDDAALCARLYQAEAAGFVRDVQAYVERFGQSEGIFKAEDYIVERDGEPVAYVFLSVPWEYMDVPDSGVRELFEYAGDRVAVVGALAMAIARESLRELQVVVPWQDGDLLELLQARVGTGSRVPLPGHTMRIINFPGLMSDLRPYVRARLVSGLRRGLRFAQEGDRYVIERGPDRLQLDGAAMTRLVMGGAGGTEVAAPAVLAEIVSELYPLPSFQPGLNFR